MAAEKESLIRDLQTSLKVVYNIETIAGELQETEDKIEQTKRTGEGMLKDSCGLVGLGITVVVETAILRAIGVLSGDFTGAMILVAMLLGVYGEFIGDRRAKKKSRERSEAYGGRRIDNRSIQ